VEAFSLNAGETRTAMEGAWQLRSGLGFAGVVEKAASDDSSPKVGTKVFGFVYLGAWAEYVVVQAGQMAEISAGPDHRPGGSAACAADPSAQSEHLCTENRRKLTSEAPDASRCAVMSTRRPIKALPFEAEHGGHAGDRQRCRLGDGQARRNFSHLFQPARQTIFRPGAKVDETEDLGANLGWNCHPMPPSRQRQQNPSPERKLPGASMAVRVSPALSEKASTLTNASARRRDRLQSFADGERRNSVRIGHDGAHGSLLRD